jgi:hypothetical protein
MLVPIRDNAIKGKNYLLRSDNNTDRYDKFILPSV